MKNAQRKSLFVGINEPIDVKNLSELEKKHIPVITVPPGILPDEWLWIQIDVGKPRNHPSDPKHHVEVVELYADETLLGRVEFSPANARSQIGFWVQVPPGTLELKAYERCNLHGRWIGRSSVTFASNGSAPTA